MLRVVGFIACAIATAGCSGCGGELADDDASDDGVNDIADASTGPCTGPFTTIGGIEELTTPRPERGLRLSGDELTAVFSGQLTDANAGRERLYLTTRGARDEQFGTPSVALFFGNNDNEPERYASLAVAASNVFYEGFCQSEEADYTSYLCMSARDGGGTFNYQYPSFVLELDSGGALPPAA